MKRTYFYFLILLVFFGGTLVYTSCTDMETEYEPKLVTYPEITLLTFTPNAGVPGSTVTITGTNFGEVEDAAKVFFNGVKASEFVSYTDAEMKVRVPEDAGEGPISVQVWTSTKAFDANFTSLPGAEITGITPAEAEAGTQITITGAHFGTDQSAVTVTFMGGAVAEIVSFSETEIVVTVPEGGISGAITVEIGDQLVKTPVFKYPFVGLDVNFDTDGDDEGWGAGNGSTYEVSGGSFNVTFDPGQFTGTNKRRADLKIEGGANVHAGLYPIIAIRINKPKSGNFIFDTNLGKYKNGSNNWEGVLNGDIYYYDIRNTFGSDKILSQTEPTTLSTFQWKIADITTDETGYSVDWIKCYESVDALKEAVALPRGKFIYEFDDATATDYWVGKQDATNVIEDGKLKVTFAASQFDGSKRRADLNFVEGGEFPADSPNGKWHYSAEYPILAFKIAFTGTGAAVPGSGNIKLDRFNGAQNNAYLTDFINDNVIYYDCSIEGGFSGDQDLASFTLKIADITSTEETGYEVDWIRSFKTVEELQTYLGK